MNSDFSERPASKAPLPAKAKKVFSGVIFDVYQWDQELFDGTHATFEKLTRADSVLVIPITAEGTIITTEQEQPGKERFPSFAGGVVDTGETPLECAKRELLEETGYGAEEFVLMNALQPVAKIEWAVYIYVARNCKKVAEQKLDAGEKISVKEISFDELLKLCQANYFMREPDVVIRVLQALLDPQKMQELKILLFGEQAHKISYGTH